MADRLDGLALSRASLMRSNVSPVIGTSWCPVGARAS
jgi:hypothetical protein